MDIEDLKKFHDGGIKKKSEAEKLMNIYFMIMSQINKLS